jgi:hypothetical protein
LIDGFQATVPEAFSGPLIDLAMKVDDVFGHRLALFDGTAGVPFISIQGSTSFEEKPIGTTAWAGSAASRFEGIFPELLDEIRLS